MIHQIIPSFSFHRACGAVANCYQPNAHLAAGMCAKLILKLKLKVQDNFFPLKGEVSEETWVLSYF